jgi:hypothetical protein
MTEDPRDPAAGLAEGMEAAGALIESLEQEVASLRGDLEGASEALKAAQEEVAASAGALEEKERARVGAERELEVLRTEISTLKQRHSDEQLRMSNEHINELARVRQKFEEQRQADVDAAASEAGLDTLKEEFRREREALEARYTEEIAALKNASENWEEQLRTGYQEQEARHAAELESIRKENEEREQGLQRSLSEDFERKIGEERSESEERHKSAVQTLRNAAATRELELEREYQAVVERQRRELDSLREELESSRLGAEERRKKEMRELKALTERRENELKKTHAARLDEVKQSAGKRVASIQAQREADNRAFRARHTEETARLRRENEERLAAEDERRKAETWALDERLREVTLMRETELRTYTVRLQELEAARLAQKTDAMEGLEQVVSRFDTDISDYESRVAELEAALRESEARRQELDMVLGEIRAGGEEPSGDVVSPLGPEEPDDGQLERLDEVEAQRILAEEKVQDLEARLREAREESRRNAEELQNALESLDRITNPERRLREGIALFNESDHARTVASISKSFGLPRVHAAIDEGTPGKPTLTFFWGDVAWRRYVSDPTDGIEEPRVYLTGAGEDPGELGTSSRQPNARMDSRGRLMIGVQAR